MSSIPPSYDQDFYGWLQQQANLLRSGRLQDLDVVHLLEEIEALGRSEKRALIAQLARLYLHLLKWHYQASLRSPSWLISIENARDEITDLLEDNPSFQADLDQSIAKAYAKGRKQAHLETGLPIERFPADNPFSFETAMTLKLGGSAESANILEPNP